VKHFDKGRVKAVDGLDLEVKAGEIYAFIGANGSGKSTTLNCLSGVLKATSGEVEVLGLPMPESRHIVTKFMGVAPQEYAVYLDLSVKENILFFADIFGVPRDKAIKRMDELAKILRLEEKINVVAKNLSGGMDKGCWNNINCDFPRDG
jgi:ABC-2 type transport system ATP-binding protein